MQQIKLDIRMNPQRLFFYRPAYKPTRNMHSSWSRISAFLCAPILLSACASLSTSAPEVEVRQRANERWQALVAGDIDRARSYHTPGFKALVSAAGYRGRIGNAGSWVGAEVTDVKCPEKAKCIVRVRIDFKPVMSRRFGDKISTHADETWLLEDSKWWMFQAI